MNEYHHLGGAAYTEHIYLSIPHRLFFYPPFRHDLERDDVGGRGGEGPTDRPACVRRIYYSHWDNKHTDDG